MRSVTRRSTHPDPIVEHLLQELERQGVDGTVIEAFAHRAAKRRKSAVQVVKAVGGLATDGASPADHGLVLQRA